MREPRNAMQCRHKAAGSLLHKKQEDHAKLAKHVGLQLQRWKSFSEDEEDLIIKLHALLGNRWSLIAGRLPGRTDIEVKNHWNSQMRRKLKTLGMDPENCRVTARLPDQRPPRNECDEHRAKHLNNVYSVNDTDRVSGSRNRALVDHLLLPDLSLELTLSIPCMHVADEQQNSF